MKTFKVYWNTGKYDAENNVQFLKTADIRALSVVVGAYTYTADGEKFFYLHFTTPTHAKAVFDFANEEEEETFDMYMAENGWIAAEEVESE